MLKIHQIQSHIVKVERMGALNFCLHAVGSFIHLRHVGAGLQNFIHLRHPAAFKQKLSMPVHSTLLDDFD